MKKLRFIFCSLMIFASLTWLTPDLNAQSNWEIGARFGHTWGVDMTIPFKAPRIHPAIYFDNDVTLGAYFDWLFSLQGGPYGLKFYPGVGPEFHFGNEFDIAAAGNFGLEYSFDFPLTIGFDWRPKFVLTDQFRFRGENWGFTARFRFGEGVKFVKSQ